eukprot:gene3483-951_t
MADKISYNARVLYCKSLLPSVVRSRGWNMDVVMTVWQRYNHVRSCNMRKLCDTIKAYQKSLDAGDGDSDSFDWDQGES